jgi:hypothetical protein
MRALWMSSGAIVWALHFGALYGFAALACARGFGGAVPWVSLATTLAALGAIAVIAVRHVPRRGEFTAWLALSAAGLALVAVVYETIPIFIVPVCA